MSRGRDRQLKFTYQVSAGNQTVLEAHDYVDETTTVANATIYTWVHPLADVISALIEEGMTLDWLHEHDAVTWHMFDVLVRGADRLWRWPDKAWLPLAFSLRATRR